METNEDRLSLEGVGLNSEQIDEVLPLLQAARATKQEAPPVGVFSASRELLEIKMQEEADPIKRAILAAKIISMSLD